jgi:hypothetical protein
MAKRLSVDAAEKLAKHQELPQNVEAMLLLM